MKPPRYVLCIVLVGLVMVATHPHHAMRWGIGFMVLGVLAVVWEWR